MVKAALWLIGLYQQWSAPRPSRCRYTPTCSEYSRQSFERHGFAKGLWLSTRRLSRCHPLGSHGYDPVPDPEPLRPTPPTLRKHDV